MAGAGPRLTLAVCAYNEEANIGGLLHALLSDPVAADAEVLVVASGCTDRTEEIVAVAQKLDTRLRLISEPERRGKVVAVNRVLREAQGDVVFLIDADCLPAPGALGVVCGLLEEPGVGGAGSRNVPVNAGAGWVARAGAAMWELHHYVCLEAPVLGGDIVAFRRVVGELPTEPGINDDFLIETALREQGFRVGYAAEAVTRMRVPTTVADFLHQRRRIHYGYMREERRSQRAKATQRPGAMARAALSLIRAQPGSIPALGLLVLLDTVGRVLARLDVLRGNAGHAAWTPAQTTKQAIES